MTDYASLLDTQARARELDAALETARQWTTVDANNPKAWNKLAYVRQLRAENVHALDAIGQAINLNSDHPGYRFEKGVIAHALGNFVDAAEAFEACASISEDLRSDYYLNAARIARGQALLDAGDTGRANEAISDVPGDAATWLDGRLTVEALRKRIEAKWIGKPSKPA